MSKNEKKLENTYKYYLLGNSMPLRVTFNENGLKMGAEAPDQDTGKLGIKNTFMSRIETSPEVEEITKDVFDQHCGQIFSKKNEANCVI